MADKKALWISGDGRRNAKQERLAALMADLKERGVIGAGMSDIGIRHDDWCPGLKRESLGWCACEPVVSVNGVLYELR